MAFSFSSLGKPRQPFVAALMLAVVIGAGILADRAGLIRLPGPSHELVGAVLPGAVVALTNNERADQGLPTLTASPLLTRAAQMKADDMAAKSYYAHVSPDGTIPPAWLSRVGYKYQIMGENLVIDRDNASEVVSAWMGSEAHRENILNRQFTEIGVGVANGTYQGQETTYVVQMFAKPYGTAAPTPAPKKVTTVTVPATAVKTPTPQPKPVSIPVKTPVIPLPAPVKTAATTTIIVRAPEPKPVLKDTIAPVLEAVVATNTLKEVPAVVASTSYPQPALGVTETANGTVVNLAPATSSDPVPHLTVRQALRSLAVAIAFEVKSIFSF